MLGECESGSVLGDGEMVPWCTLSTESTSTTLRELAALACMYALHSTVDPSSAEGPCSDGTAWEPGSA